ncbi:MAG TPA: M20 family metallo-hydrolase [Gemmataceae bacterium]|nr:M20 family metallo-hydrolase [Gemmataceae bacterium]
MSWPRVKVNVSPLWTELEQLAQISDVQPPAVTRILFTANDRKARAFLKDRFAEASLSVREDPAGNIFARWHGEDAQAVPIATGSHIDAVPFSGRYDGTVGVLGALEAIRALQRSGWRPARSIDLVVFTSEEPTRFGIGCLGSRLLSGSLSAEQAAALIDSEGKSFEYVRRQAGCTGSLEDVRVRVGHYAAFVELHIEQGRILEQKQLPIGVVTAIAGPAALRVELTGEGGHAGAVLMPDRKDALCAAAEIILAAEEAAKGSGSPDTVATTGVCRVHPAAINSIPSKITLEIDVRDIDLGRRDQVLEQIQRAAHAVGQRRGLATEVAVRSADSPGRAGSKIIHAIQAACRHLGHDYLSMVSRAYHDSLFMAQLAPTGMIFIPCRGGVSHRPDEYTSPEAIGVGVEVLALTLVQLASDTSENPAS